MCANLTVILLVVFASTVVLVFVVQIYLAMYPVVDTATPTRFLVPVGVVIGDASILHVGTSGSGTVIATFQLNRCCPGGLLLHMYPVHLEVVAHYRVQGCAQSAADLRDHTQLDSSGPRGLRCENTLRT